MNPLKKLVRKLTKSWDPIADLDIDDKIVGWHKIGGSSTYGYYRSNEYENGYSSIRKLADAFLSIDQYTIDKTGKSIPSNVLDRLYYPNTDMSHIDFREALAVCTRVQDVVRLQVHHRTSRITADTITGFTFMENYTTRVVAGKRLYSLQNGTELTDEHVISLKDTNPDNLSEGFSPGRAAKRWTTLDDYIADYQAGFFRNGAVPAGQMIITARTSTEFNDIVDMLEQRHKGAGKNNNLTYTHRPTDQNGTPLNSQIEWVPFSSQNKDMALKDLFDNVNKKIDSSYGVPASIRAVNDQNTYASVRIDEYIFAKYAVYPMALKIWSKFTFELNRITGGTGLAVSFDYDMPTVADEEKVKAEARQTDATTVSTLTTEGYTVDSAIEYIKTNDIQVLILAETKDEEAEIQTTDELKDTPEQPIDGYMKVFKVKKLSDNARNEYENELQNVVRKRMNVQINRVVDNYDNLSKAISLDDPIETVEDTLLTNEMLSVLLTELSEQGSLEQGANYRLLYESGIDIDNIDVFRMNPEQRAKYNAYVEKVATGYNQETAEKIREVIRTGREANLPAAEIKSNLKGLIEEYRIKRIAVSEVNRAGNEASLMSMQNISKQTGAKVDKVWVHDGGDTPCEYCVAMIGSRVPLNDNFVNLGGEVKGVDGGVFINTFVPIEVAEIHPNGHCRQVYEVRS